MSGRHTGFPTPGEDHFEFNLDLNSYAITNPSSTFFVRVEGNSMEGVGIFSGDLLIVDRSVNPENGRIVLAVVDGDFTVKRLREKSGKKFFMADPRYEEHESEPLEISEKSDCYVWGVVIGSLHKFLF
jgi:DNA polymerase V